MRISIRFTAVFAVLMALTAPIAAKNNQYSNVSGAGGGGTFTPGAGATFTPAGKTTAYVPPSGGGGWTFGAAATSKKKDDWGDTKARPAVNPNYAPSSDSTAYQFGAAVASNGRVPNCGPGSPSGLPCPEKTTSTGVRKKG